MNDDDDRALQIAAQRYRIIAEAAEVDAAGVTAAIVAAAVREYLDLDGEVFRVGERALWRWLKAYRAGGFLALRPKTRSDAGLLRAFPAEVLTKAGQLRQANHARATKTIIDALQRTKLVRHGVVCRATLDRHLEHLGLSRRQLGGLGQTTYRLVKTDLPLELVIADFHHGPYVRVGEQEKARRALLLIFIDHFSRAILEGRYYLHEDFAALRFGFRRLLLVSGLFVRLYVDNGPSFQSARFAAACSNQDLHLQLVHSKPYVAEGRGVCERFNRTVKEQFESEVRARDELLTLDELNAYFEAWLAERYHQDRHSETGEPPAERLAQHIPPLQPAPDLARIEELLRLRQRSTVHKKWSTVQVLGTRYVVDPALRGRRVHTLYDPFEPAYVLVEFDGRIVQRAWPQQPGEVPPQPEKTKALKVQTDYLALLRRDYEQRTQNELAALDLRPREVQRELPLRELVALLESCRGTALTAVEHATAAAAFRKLQPIEPGAARTALASALRRLGPGLHLRSYLDDLQHTLVRQRTKGGKPA